MKHVFRTSVLLLISLLALSCLPAFAGQVSAPAASTAQSIAGLGTASFPTSTKSAEAQTAFIRGLLLLHLFEYQEAADAFIAAQKLDPNFAMAYWGEAMTYNHPVWNQVDPEHGKAALAKFAPTTEARAARIANPREKGYMAAVEILYDGTGTKADRDHRYAGAMQRLAASYPNDDEVQLFYALALLGQSEGVRDVPVYLRAADISRAVFQRQPNHPGAAHYWIHGIDDPDHAAGALVAARALSKIAPDADHGQHMCSHIFIALGMWDDVVEANVDAIRVDNAQSARAGLPQFGCGHYSEWLLYGYFQQGRFHDAQQTLIGCQRMDSETAEWMKAHPGSRLFGAKDAAQMHKRLANSLVPMRNTAVIESQDWSGPAATLPVDTAVLWPDTAAWYAFGSGYAAAQRGDLAEAHKQLQAMNTASTQYQASSDRDDQDVKALAIATGELSALIHSKEHNFDAALADARQASDAYQDMAFAFGPPATVKPPAELLGEILLQKGDAPAARQAFQLSLQRAPKRTQSLLGLARAQRASGDTAAATATYQQLLAIWHAADPEIAGLDEARHTLSSQATRTQ